MVDNFFMFPREKEMDCSAGTALSTKREQFRNTSSSISIFSRRVQCVIVTVDAERKHFLPSFKNSKLGNTTPHAVSSSKPER